MSNSFGTLFRFTTWGESHGKAIGVVIDGCPAGLAIDEELIFEELKRRRPGFSCYTSPRKEEDRPELLSGIYEGKTTGSPISIIIYNQDVKSSAYTPMQELLRPGHANFTYREKYGHFDPRGGGRASARETVCRVAAGSIAKVFLRQHRIEIEAKVVQIGEEKAPEKFEALLQQVMAEGDSIGGIIECCVEKMPVGLGEPIYAKLEAILASAMLSIPATKGFEIGDGFHAATMRGSLHNDLFIQEEGKIKTKTNHAGGVLGGISSGMPLRFRVAFKPTSSIKQAQETIDGEGRSATLVYGEGHRHDPCVALRAPVIVEAMTALVLADFLLMNQVY
jgi:chorismate synthase